MNLKEISKSLDIHPAYLSRASGATKVHKEMAQKVKAVFAKISELRGKNPASAPADRWKIRLI